ncbi:MAG: apolipoprotein N-acyltransferase [Candidatus Marinimicrobia bacterium]|nr:apolipoprotein N-acyltransferase [Candidatus Neomarinimicrobiota bacterium]MCF7850701.1 apolipoprotein N-acyltransferase [Candidatus Neomarinimicrobiota bacterium]MCF7905155.1 apolipoprotein N-acyltransferase [Candidatus Neomarinimicrobiota bacterium]
MTKRFTEETLAIFSGLLLTLSFPPFDMFFMAWVAWIPLWAGIRQANWEKGFKLGFITGFIFTLTSLNWIANNSGTSFWIASLSMIASVAYLSLWYGLFGAIFARTGRNLGSHGLWLAPIFWVSVEFLYSFQDYTLAFPWLSMALTQNFAVPLLQLAEYGGIYVVSFWVLLINTILFQLEFGKIPVKIQQLLWGGLALIIAGTFIFGAVRMKVVSEESTSTIRVGIIQTNLDPHQKWIRSKKSQHVKDVIAQSEKVIADSAVIIFWPESAVPAHLKYYPHFDRKIRKLVEDHGVSILTGALHHVEEGGDYRFFNSAFFYSPGMPVEIYSKRGLVPFAERIPLVENFPKLKSLNFGQANFEKGDEATVFPMGSREEVVDIGTMICYESANPYLFRQFIQNDAGMMSIITNDAWLGQSPGPYQHLAAGRLRAIEHHISVARAAQTGISAMILPNGRLAATIPMGEKGEIVYDAPLGLERTLYSKYGNVFALTVVLLAALSLFLVMFSRQKKT